MNKGLLWTILGVALTALISIATYLGTSFEELEDTDQALTHRVTVLESNQITRGQMLERENRITIIEKDVESLEEAQVK